jgi:hypothetical protein
MSRKRLNSTAEVKAAEATGNLNVEWMNERHWWPTYIAMIVSFRLLIFYFAPYLDQAGQWTLSNAAHAAVSLCAHGGRNGMPARRRELVSTWPLLAAGGRRRGGRPRHDATTAAGCHGAAREGPALRLSPHPPSPSLAQPDFLLRAQVTFWALHWNRGSPVWRDQGEHVDQTVWEQVRGAGRSGGCCALARVGRDALLPRWPRRFPTSCPRSPPPPFHTRVG